MGGCPLSQRKGETHTFLAKSFFFAFVNIDAKGTKSLVKSERAVGGYPCAFLRQHSTAFETTTVWQLTIRARRPTKMPL